MSMLQTIPLNIPYPQLEKQNSDNVAECPLTDAVGLIHMDE